MKSLTYQIHLKNMLQCISEIEICCADLTAQQIKNPELIAILNQPFTIMGLEAENSNINHPVIHTLKSFKCGITKNELAQDTFALYNFIVNDLNQIKSTLKDLQVKNKFVKHKNQAQLVH